LNYATYTNNENWLGSYYELCLELGPMGDDDHLKKALGSLWSQPALSGPWRDRAHVGRSVEKPSGDLLDPLYGLMKIDEHVEVGCVSHVVREDEGSDWLDLCIPTGMLELVYPVRYPIDPKANPWTRRLDRIFCSIGAGIFAQARFELGVLGEEVSGMLSYRTLGADDLQRGVLLLPMDRWGHFATGHIPVTPGLVCIGIDARS
jgi:hypothetical protein